MLKIKKYKNFFKKYRLYLAIFVLVVGTFLLSKIPYLNLFLLYSTGLLIWFFAIIVAGFKGAVLIKVAILFLLITILLTLFNEKDFAERVGNGIYYILFTAVVLQIKDFIRNKK